MTLTKRGALLAQIESVLEKSYYKKPIWYGVGLGQIEDLLAQGLIAPAINYNGSATSTQVIDLMRRHPEMTAHVEYSKAGVVFRSVSSYELNYWDRRTYHELMNFAVDHTVTFEMSTGHVIFRFN